MTASASCRCGKRLFEEMNEGTCLWCGYGDINLATLPPRVAGRERRRRLPWNLGALQREGRVADPRCDNVVARRPRALPSAPPDFDDLAELMEAA